MKKMLSLALAALMLVASLTACGQSGTPASQTPDQSPAPSSSAPEASPIVSGPSDETLYVVGREEPDHLCCHYSMNSETGAMIHLAMYDYLLYLNNETGEFESCAATAYEWIDDQHMRVTLRDDIVAYDGTILTANDVLYSINLGLNGNNLSSWSMIDGNECYVEDEFTVVIGTNQIYPTLENLMSTCGFLPLVDESSVEAVGGWEVAYRDAKISTGKYFLEEWADGEYIRLVRNDDHWDKDDLPYYKYIEISFVNDAATRAMALQSGEADVSMSLTSAQDGALGAGQMWYGFGDASKTLWMNCSSGALADERVREAIFWLIDNEAMIAICTNGVGSPTETNFSTASAYYVAPSADYDRHVDVEKAKALLADAGYADGVTINAFALASDQAGMELIQSMLSAAGIEVKIEMVEAAAGMSKMGSGDYEMYLGAAYGFDPVRLLNRVDGRVAPAQAGGGAQYNSEELNAIIDIARYSLDTSERKQAYADAQQHILDHTVCIGFYMDCVRYGVADGLGGAVYDCNGYLYLDNLAPVG